MSCGLLPKRLLKLVNTEVKRARHAWGSHHTGPAALLVGLVTEIYGP
jgi:hypothetical protein